MATETLLDLIAADAVEYFCAFDSLPDSIGLSESAYYQLGKPDRVFNLKYQGILEKGMFSVYTDQ